jgi:hypothetical protein
VTNVQPGDLAYITYTGLVLKELQGRIVTVGPRMYEGQTLNGFPMHFRGFTGVVWLVRAENGDMPMRVSHRNSGRIYLIYRKEIALPDLYLRKITGPRVLDTEHTRDATPHE